MNWVQYNSQPSAIFQPSDSADRSIQLMVAICADQLFLQLKLFIIGLYNMYYYSYYYCHIVPFIISAIQSLLKSSLRRSTDSMRMHKVKHCTSCLPQLSIVGYS